MFFVICAAEFLYSDQLAWISKSQAEQTIDYFKENDITQVILWCACCENDPKVLVNITKIYYRKAESSGYYEVFIEGTSTYGSIKQPVDLAYVHIQRGIKWYCLGRKLKFDCDPCTKPFKF